MKYAAAIALLMFSPAVAIAAHEMDAGFTKQAAAISDACKSETFSGGTKIVIARSASDVAIHPSTSSG